jgi:hypothetical protein
MSPEHGPAHKCYSFLEDLESTEFPQPSDVVATALAEIQCNGSVLEYDEELEEWLGSW